MGAVKVLWSILVVIAKRVHSLNAAHHYNKDNNISTRSMFGCCMSKVVHVANLVTFTVRKVQILFKLFFHTKIDFHLKLKIYMKHFGLEGFRDIS